MSVYIQRHDPEKDIDAEALAELRGYRCEVRGPKCAGRGTQRHHGLIRRRLRSPERDALINYQLACYVCHTQTGFADSKENHESFYQMQCERYGKDFVDRWIEEREML